MSPNRLSQPPNISTYFEDTLETARLHISQAHFMPQATEKARNGRDQQIAANGLSTPQDAIAILLHRLVLPTQIHHSLATAH